MDKADVTDLVVFRPQGAKVAVEVKLKDETVWLSQKQMSALFDKSVRTVNEHIINIFREKELGKASVIRKFRITASDGKTYDTVFYNLDVVISVGYRVKSKRGTQFRIWATNILKQHLVQGFSINEKRLKEQAENLKALQRTAQMLVEISQRKSLTSDEAKGLFEVIRDYSYALDVLDDYDHGRVKLRAATARKSYELTYDEGVRIIQQMREKFGVSGLFGHEKDNSFKSALGVIYQTFGGKDLYPSVEEKAANLLYLVVKNHAFSDGNKRIAAALFVWFLDRNKILYKADGARRIADNALVAITLMIAESQPKEKNVIAALVANLINKLN
jgi:prophage maintenance system killer protein